jgi:hypothetical protein
MVGARNLALLVSLGVIVAACAPAPPPAITAPPEPADAEAWPAMTWSSEVVEQPPDGKRDESVTGVAADERTIVAVGYASGPGEDLGQAWWSDLDGPMTRADGPFVGATLLDVAAGPGGFVALGTRLGEPQTGGTTRLTLFASADGRTWRQVLDGAAAPEGFANGIAGSADGYLVTGYSDPEPGSIVLTSADGATWTKVDATIDGATGAIGMPTADADGWIAPGGPRFGSSAVSIVRSPDGVAWTSTPLEPDDTNGQYVDRVLPGGGGYLARGLVGDECGPFASCAGESVTWWSADGVTWGRQAGVDRSIALSAWATHPDRGFVAATGTLAQASADGWRWTAIGTGRPDDVGVDDLVVIGDRIVGGGTSSRDDGTMRASFLIGAPE